MAMDQIHLLIDIITPCVLAAIFVINLLQSKVQAKNKEDLDDYQNRVKDDLHQFNGQVRDSIANLKEEVSNLRVEVKVHVGRDEEYQAGMSRTLHRIDAKLEKLKGD